MLKIFNYWPFLWRVGQMRRRAGHEGRLVIRTAWLRRRVCWLRRRVGRVGVLVGCQDWVVV